MKQRIIKVFHTEYKRIKESTFKHKYPDEYLFILNNTQFLTPTAKFNERKYCILNDITETPKCIHCDKPVKFNNATTGYKLFCNNICSQKSEYTKNKRKTAYLKKYGVDNPFKSTMVINKIKNTMLNKYGVDNPSKSEILQEKKKLNNIKKYGVAYYSQTDEGRNIQRNKRWSQKSKDSFKQTLNNRDASYWNKKHIHLQDTLIKKYNKKYTNYHLLKDKETLLQQFRYYNTESRAILALKLNLPQPMIDYAMCKLHINHLYRSAKSGKEQYLHDFLIDNGISVEKTNRSIIHPLELDIFLPDYNIAIEFNGDYWHTDQFKHKNYHQNKSILCEEKGIRLIHIFEHELNDKLLKWLLNQIKPSKSIYARKCKLRQLNNKDYRSFLEGTHLQGYANASIKYGLYYNNELVSAMSFGKRRFDNKDGYELIRYASKYKVIGGASKIFKHFLKEYAPDNVISYQNLSKFNGNLYKMLGFTFSHISNPNYHWYNGSKLYTRYQCMKHKLVEQGYDKNLTENQIMRGRGFFKLYDSGNKAWVYYK